MPKRKETDNNKPRWIKPFQYAKFTDINPTTITNQIKREKFEGTPAPFKWMVDPKKPNRFLIEYIPNIEDKNKQTQLEKLKNIANVDQKISLEKLRKLEISNRKEEGLYVDKNKFNKEYFVFLRSARDKLQSLVRKWRIKKDKLSGHEFEKYCMKDVNKILNELATFEYYDKDNNGNT